MHRIALATLLTCAILGPPRISRAEPATTVQVTVEVEQTPYDGLQQLFDDEASQALADGDLERAWQMYWRLLKIDPTDLHALREAGRVANALGKFDYAVEALGKVEVDSGGKPDPELHYLRGVSLYALDRKDDAETEFKATETDLATAPLDRRGTLWLARIQVLRGDLKGALALYEPLATDDAPGTATYAEVRGYEVEAHILCRDWKGAETTVRAFLKEAPDDARGKALLAWVLEGRKKIDEELILRRAFADDWTDHPQKTLEYARALERAYDYPDALRQYREARSLGVEEAGESIVRLRHRLSPEVGVGMIVRDDPSGTIGAWQAAASVPIANRTRVAVQAVDEQSTGGIFMDDRNVTTAQAWLLHDGRRGSMMGLGAVGQLDDMPGGLGASGVYASSPERKLQLQARGDYNVPWHESASVLRNGGEMDSLAATAYLTTSRHLLFSVGGVGRRYGLDPLPGGMDDHALQILGEAGMDVLVGGTGRAARGEIYDADMIAPRSLNSAMVLSYRHYEMRSQDPFPERVLLVERSSVEEVSGAFRRVMDARGILAGELRGGIGYDWDRQMKMWRAGASVLLSASTWSRFTFDYDVANETGSGIVGRRHTGSVVLHVDL
jgi:tetratricopeptide (TPR) repeat protein